MNRTDRLVAMVMFLQGRRVVRAEELAAHFEITVRTVYRDIAALSEAGVPVAGEAGVGYSLVKGYHLPPVMFTADEAMALFIGGEMVKQFTDASLVSPMFTALLKIRSVLPRERQDDVERLTECVAVDARCRSATELDQRVLLPIQHAILARRVLRIAYRARDRRDDLVREVEPLGVTFYGGSWYLVAWCRLRGDFRHFKIERIRELELRDEHFKPRPGFSLREHLAASAARAELLPATVWFSHGIVDRARRESFGGLGNERVVADGVEADMLTFSYNWLVRWVLSLGGDAEIVGPPAARDELRTALERLQKRHAVESLLT